MTDTTHSAGRVAGLGDVLRPLLFGALLLSTTVALTFAALWLGEQLRLTVLSAFATVVLSVLPGWLFVRFVAFSRGPLWDEFVLDLHRLAVDEPRFLPPAPRNAVFGGAPLPTSADEAVPDSIYAKKFQAYYGRPPVDGDADDGAAVSTLVPALLTTVLLTVGWSTVLGGGDLAGDPRLSAVLRAGFAGAYVFVVQLMVRRYFQGDLRPSAYIAAAVRVVTVCVVLAVLHASWLRHAAPDVAIAVAFTVGFFPLLGMQAVHKLAARALRDAVPSLRNEYPLSDLDGLSVWYEARLLEEGIEDLQGLVTANLVDVMLHTRVPVGRLVDWIDQALLLLHLEPRPAVRRGAVESVRGSRERLRAVGIRCATDLEDVVAEASGAATANALSQALSADRLDLPALVVIRRALRRDPALAHVRAWKAWQPTASTASPRAPDDAALAVAS